MIVEQPYALVWAASMEVAAESRLAFRMLDHASGYFLTQPMLTPFGDREIWWDCGTDEFPNLDVVAEISMVVARMGDQRTRVRVYTSNIQTTQGRQCTSRGVLEATLLDGITERAHELGAS
jgi:hypothetical protein